MPLFWLNLLDGSRVHLFRMCVRARACVIVVDVVRACGAFLCVLVDVLAVRSLIHVYIRVCVRIMYRPLR